MKWKYKNLEDQRFWWHALGSIMSKAHSRLGFLVKENENLVVNNEFMYNWVLPGFKRVEVLGLISDVVLGLVIRFERASVILERGIVV